MNNENKQIGLFPHLEAKNEMIKYLHQNGTKVIVYFAGSEDDGQIDRSYNYPEMFYHYANEILNKTEWDWYNDDGGQGTITFFVDENNILQIAFQLHTNTMTTTLREDWIEPFPEVNSLQKNNRLIMDPYPEKENG